jgi:methionine-rich copper-binding protein CopC
MPDTVPPAGQSATVTAGYYTTLSVPVTLGNGSDALSGVDAASGVLERESATLSAGSCASWSGTWSPVTLSGGADTTVQTNRCYHYRYAISDNVGNQSAASSTSADVKVDATAPATSDDAPGAWQNAPVTVTLSVTETGSGVASTQYRVDGGAFQGGTSVVIPAPADHSNDAVHTIEYRSTDNAGNAESLQSATVRIDTTLPTTTDDAPAGWQDAPVTVTLTPADALSGIASTQYRVDGGAFQGGSAVLIAAPADHSNDGVHTIEYRSIDNAGNIEGLQSATVSIDTTLPAGALTAPSDGAHVNGVVPISASASDAPAGVASVEFLVKPNGAGSFTSISTDTTAPYDASWDSTSAAEGNADVKVVVLDNAGHSTTSATRTLVVDNPPTPSLADPGANIRGTFTLSATSEADTAQVVFERRAGGGAWTPIGTDTSAPFSADLDTSALADGDIDLRAIATDGGGFSGTSPLRTTRVDNTAPTAVLTDPATGAVVGGPNVHLAGSATDTGSGVASVRFEQRAAGGGSFAPIGTDTSAPFEASWDSTGLNGNYELRAISTDTAGNETTSATIPVIVDQTVPSVTLGDPGALVRGTVQLSATTQSAAVASVAFERRAAGGSWTRFATDPTSPWAASLDTTQLSDGTFDLRALALGGTGQVLATHERDGIRVDNTAPTLASSTPADGASVSTVSSIVLVASEPVASVQGASLDGSTAAGDVSGANVTFSAGALDAGSHTLTGTFVDAAGNSGAFSLHFTIRVQAQAVFVLTVKKPKAKASGSKRVFLVPLSLSAPAAVQATLFSPTGRKLRTQTLNLSAGAHSLRFVLPKASLPPGKYTVVVVATDTAGTRSEKRVTIKVKAAKKPTKAHAKKAVAFTSTETPPAEPPASTSGDSAPRSNTPAATPPPSNTHPAATRKHRSPKAALKPLETATGYTGSNPGKTIGIVGLMLGLGAVLLFFIKSELSRILAPRRLP